ncbi:MAG TPA: hypothetical protein VGQ58_08505 [Candidatus Limnocylindrales bacterium]|jgi:hypothetical protein|nr:hypothetical protein [Candidatus Limnocylindrales bacterium]
MAVIVPGASALVIERGVRVAMPDPVHPSRLVVPVDHEWRIG